MRPSYHVLAITFSFVSAKHAVCISVHEYIADRSSTFPIQCLTVCTGFVTRLNTGSSLPDSARGLGSCLRWVVGRSRSSMPAAAPLTVACTASCTTV
uniref:Putative secreted protein n=1 Tax=Ixodes ricinus TaxID=34613 RepID=A0A6B0UDH0_IXORI